MMIAKLVWEMQIHLSKKGGEFMLKLMSLALIMLPGVALASGAVGGDEVTWVTPEPTTILLLVSGLLGLWGIRKKFHK